MDPRLVFRSLVLALVCSLAVPVSGASWITKKIVASDGDGGDQFGDDVDIWGSFAIVGASYHQAVPQDGTLVGGAAYIFMQAITPPPGSFGFFGEVDLDGGRLILAASYPTPQARVYVVVPTQGWQLEGILTDPSSQNHDLFGTTVSISGNLAVVGAAGDSDVAQASGAAYGTLEAPRNGTLQWDAPAGIVTYVPKRGFVGEDRFRLSVWDKSGTRNEVAIEVLVQGASR